MMRPGPRNLITDVVGLRVGNAADAKLKSGVTVLAGPSGFGAAVHVMGGAPGTRETALLAPDRLVDRVDALVLSGGSAHGLDAASGVMAALHEAGRGFAVGPVNVPIVPAAIIFDLLNGGDKDWKVNPYPGLGRAAFEAAAAEFDLGSAGAGTGATTANFKGGLGSASAVLEDGTVVGALVVVNSMGAVTAPGSRRFWAAPFEEGAEFGGLGVDPQSGLGGQVEVKKRIAAGANTTIAVVATDAALAAPELQRMAIASHDGMARAVVPCHTPFDGDLVFAVSTGARPPQDDAGAVAMLGHAAAICLARAIARAVYHARPEPGDTLPCWSDI